MKKIVIVHTSLVSHDELNRLFAELIPEATVDNIIDDSLLKEVKTVGDITPGIISRMIEYFKAAESIGADLIFNQCSSVGEAAEIAAQAVSIPVLRVDRAMAEEAVKAGNRIAVVATVGSTMKPSCRNVERAAEAAGKEITIVPVLIDGAMDILMNEGPERHNQLIIQKLLEIDDKVDAIVLAQGSMTAILPDLPEMSVPVFTSPRLGVEKARKMLFGE